MSEFKATHRITANKSTVSSDELTRHGFLEHIEHFYEQGDEVEFLSFVEDTNFAAYFADSRGLEQIVCISDVEAI